MGDEMRDPLPVREDVGDERQRIDLEAVSQFLQRHPAEVQVDALAAELVLAEKDLVRT